MQTVMPKVMKSLKVEMTSPTTSPEPMKSSRAGPQKQPQKQQQKLNRFSELPTPWQRNVLRLRITHPSVPEAAAEVERFARLFMRRERPARRLIVFGGIGSGKTTAVSGLAAWANRIGTNAWECGYWPRPPRTIFVRWQVLCDAIEGSRSGFTEFIDPMLDDDLIVLDDAGAESDRYRSGKSLDALSYLLSSAQEKNWLALTMNYGPAEWGARFDPRIEDRLLRDAILADFAQAPSWAKL